MAISTLSFLDADQLDECLLSLWPSWSSEHRFLAMLLAHQIAIEIASNEDCYKLSILIGVMRQHLDGRERTACLQDDICYFMNRVCVSRLAIFWLMNFA
jgi:hypothetical protein